MTDIISRSALYMPADNARALEKATTLAADAIIIDLEDAVAPDAKEAARQGALDALVNRDYGNRLRVLRVNGIDTPWYEDDMAIVGEAKPDALLLPKVESADMVGLLQQQLDRIEKAGNIKIWVMMETPKAILNAATIAGASNICGRLDTLCVGTNDLVRASNMKIGVDRTLLMPWLMQLVAAAKANGLNIIDGVCNDFSDLNGLKLECIQGAAMGMDGKTLIHPKQIELANEAFSPSAEEIRDAQLIMDTFAKQPDAGVIKINGRMVERLHLDMANRTLDIAKRIKS